MGSQYVIGVGYAPTDATDYIDLMSNGYSVVDGTWSNLQMDASAGVATHQIEILIQGTDANDRVAKIRALEAKLHQAAYGAGRYGQGTFVSFGVRQDTTTWAHFPFMRNRSDQNRCGRVIPGVRYAGNTQQLVTLVMYTWWNAIRDEIALTVSGAITVGTGNPAQVSVAGNSGLWIPDVQTDTNCPMSISITDNSGGSKVINELWIGRRSAPNMTIGDFKPVRDVTFLSPGTSVTAAGTTVGGTHARVVISDDWQTFGYITGGTPVVANRGVFDVLGIARDNSTAQAPTGLNAFGVSSGGTWPDGGYTFWLTQLFGAVESLAVTDGDILSGGNDNSVSVNFTPHGTPTSIRLYHRLNPSGAIFYQETSDVDGSHSFPDPGTTVGTVPTTSTIGTASVKPRDGLASRALMRDAPAFNVPIITNWTLMNLGQHYLPPILRHEAFSEPQWAMEFQAKSGGFETQNLDLDAVLLFPADEPFLHVIYPNQNLATQRIWTIATNYNTGSSCLLQSKTDNSEQGHLLPIGYMMMAPGDNHFIIAGAMAAGEHNVQYFSVTALVKYRPTTAYLFGV